MRLKKTSYHKIELHILPTWEPVSGGGWVWGESRKHHLDFMVCEEEKKRKYQAIVQIIFLFYIISWKAIKWLRVVTPLNWHKYSKRSFTSLFPLNRIKNSKTGDCPLLTDRHQYVNSLIVASASWCHNQWVEVLMSDISLIDGANAKLSVAKYHVWKAYRR